MNLTYWLNGNYSWSNLDMSSISLGAAASRLFGEFFGGAVGFSHDTVDG